MSVAPQPGEREPILASWKVSEVLARYPELVDVLAELSPAFHHLRNPVIRRVQTPLVTIAQAAGVAGLEPAALVRSLNAAVGLSAPVEEPLATEPKQSTPAVLAEAPVAEELDVRPLLARGEEPFHAITAAAGRVPPGAALRLRVPFEPLPLYDVLGRRGFSHTARQLGADDWEVLFVRGAAEPAASPEPREQADVPRSADPAEVPDAVIRIDVSELVPPEPMVRILEAASRLQPGQTLLVEHVRRPVYLYPQLDAQGFVHETEEPEPGRVFIRISRADGGRQ